MSLLKVIAFGLCAALLGAVAAKLDTRARLARAAPAPDCADVPCPHLHVRLAAIRSVIAQQGPGPVYLAIGDSLVEFAELEPVCGRRALNAGIGWATARTFEREAADLAHLARPDFVVVALGTNDAQRRVPDYGARMARLVASLKGYPVILVPAPGGPAVGDVAPYNAALEELAPIAPALASPALLADGVHLAPAAYVDWRASIMRAAEAMGLCG